MNYLVLKYFILLNYPIEAAQGSDESIAQAINSNLVPTIGKLSAHDIRQYLMLMDLLLPIESSNTPSCVAATRALDIFPIFDLSNPLILNKFTQILDDLVSDSLIPTFTETNKNTILNMAYSNRPAFGQTVSNQDVAIALRG